MQNRESGIIHRLLPQAKESLRQWKVACGWHFATSANARMISITAAYSHKLICEKCLAEIRGSKKAAVATRALGQEGGAD